MLTSREEETRQDIYSAVRRLDLVDPSRLLEFQFRLADAILEAEADTGKTSGFNRHAYLLRRCQDSLAFRPLAPHALRQLLGTESPRAHCISGQGDGFETTRKTAERYAKDGHLVLLADLSHVVRVGDLIVCDNPCVPSIIEVKAGRLAPKHATQGRRGRQISRSLGTIEYLQNDYAHVLGQPIPKLALQSREAMQFNWNAVNDVAVTALREGIAIARISDYDVIIAVHAADGRPVSGDPILGDIERMRSPCFASHAVGLLRPEMLTLPPLAWPIDDAPILSLMEEQLVVGHAIDLARFTDPVEEGFRVLSASYDHGFLTDRSGERGTASVRFIYDVMFGYATIESTIAALREMHDLTKTAIEGLRGELPPQASPIAIECQGLNLHQHPASILETRDARFRIVRESK